MFPAGSPGLWIWRELSQSCLGRKALLSHQPDLSKHCPAFDTPSSRDKQDCMSCPFPEAGQQAPVKAAPGSHRCKPPCPPDSSLRCSAGCEAPFPPASSTGCWMQPSARPVGQPKPSLDRARLRGASALQCFHLHQRRQKIFMKPLLLWLLHCLYQIMSIIRGMHKGSKKKKPKKPNPHFD